MTILLLRVITLEGAIEGIKYMFIPDISKLFTVKIWTEAATQSCFQYTCGLGLGTTLASFRKIDSKVVRASTLIPVINAFSGILASFVVFGYLGHYIHIKNITFSELPISGPSLLFITYPCIFSTMPWPNFWMGTFFFTMILLGIDTEFGDVEVVISYVRDCKPKYKGCLLS